MSATRCLTFVGVFFLLACGASAQESGVVATDDLIASLQSGDPARIQEAVEGLSLSGAAVVPAVTAELENQQPAVRAGAARILGSIADARSVDPLISLLTTDQDKTVRSAAARALGGIRDPRTVNTLMYAARGEEPHLEVRVAALTALGEQGNPEGIYYLVRTIRVDFNPDVCDAAAVALQRLTGENFGTDHRLWLQWIRKNHPEWLKTAPKTGPNVVFVGMMGLMVAAFCGLSIYMAFHKWKTKQ